MPAAASEYTRYDPVALPGGAMLLLNTPAGWQAGDRTVMLVFDGADPPALRDRLVGSLLSERAAVLEVPRPALRAALGLLASGGLPGPVLLLSVEGERARLESLPDTGPPGTAEPVCEALAWAMAAVPTPVTAPPPAAARIGQDCREALAAGR